jgi:hypothetical protein
VGLRKKAANLAAKNSAWAATTRFPTMVSPERTSCSEKGMRIADKLVMAVD